MERLSVSIVALLVALFVVVGCSTKSDEDTKDTQKVSGLITDVKASSLLELESIEVLDDEGVQWRFQASRGGLTSDIHGFTPSHLREHMVQGARIVVTYVKDGGVLIIVNIGE
jgi:hypothetical protein